MLIALPAHLITKRDKGKTKEFTFIWLFSDPTGYTPTHLVILMEYAAGGELFERIFQAGRFSEDEARFFLSKTDIWS
jgi:hypothetical protein